MFVNTAPHPLNAFETFLNEVNDNAHVDKDGTVGQWNGARACDHDSDSQTA